MAGNIITIFHVFSPTLVTAGNNQFRTVLVNNKVGTCCLEQDIIKQDIMENAWEKYVLFSCGFENATLGHETWGANLKAHTLFVAWPLFFPCRTQMSLRVTSLFGAGCVYD